MINLDTDICYVTFRCTCDIIKRKNGFQSDDKVQSQIHRLGREGLSGAKPMVRSVSVNHFTESWSGNSPKCHEPLHYYCEMAEGDTIALGYVKLDAPPCKFNLSG